MIKNRNLDKLALTKVNQAQSLIDTLNNSITANLLLAIEELQNIDNTTLVESDASSYKLVILLKTMSDNISLLQSVDFNKLINLADTIDDKVLAVSADTLITQQAKNDTVTAISQASLYNPTVQERRYKSEFFGLKLL